MALRFASPGFYPPPLLLPIDWYGVCLKTEELRWGSPTATPPFEPLGLAPKEMLKDILPLLELNGQFDKLTDRTEGTLVPELAEGASLNSIFIPSFTHLAPNYVFFIPRLCFCLFREIPC